MTNEEIQQEIIKMGADANLTSTELFAFAADATSKSVEEIESVTISNADDARTRRVTVRLKPRTFEKIQVAMEVNTENNENTWVL